MEFNIKGLVFSSILTLIAYVNIFPQNNDFTDTAFISGSLEKARKFNVKNELDSSIYYDKLLVSIYLIKKDTLNAARMYNFIAKLYQKKFEFDSAFAYIRTGLDLFPQNTHLPISEKGELYNSLGTFYYSLGDYANALIYFKEALNIRLKFNAPNEKVIGDSYTNIGNIQFVLERYDDALYYYKKALDQRLSQKNINNIMAAKNHNNIGYTYLQKNNITEAKKHFEKAFSYAPLAVIYYNLGKIDVLEKRFRSADTSLNKALEIRLAHVGVKHYLTAQSYAALAELERAKKNYEKALKYYSEGLTSCLKSTESEFFNNSKPIFYNIISLKDFFICLNGKAEMLVELAKNDSAICRLEYAKKLLSFCIPLLSDIQGRYEIDDSKLKLRELSDNTMNLGLEVCYDLYRLTGNKKYAAEAFLFSDTKRNAVLNESKKKRGTMLELQVPDSIIILETALRQKLNRFFITSEEVLTEENDTKTSSRENQIINTVNSYDSLVNIIKKDYPKYASLISAGNLLPLEELQRQIPENDILVEYTLTKEHLFIICLTNNYFTLIKKAKHALFDDMIYDYNNSLKKIDKKVYTLNAKALYKELIKPFEKELLQKRNLTINPCPELASLPFEALISTKGILLVKSANIQYSGTSNNIGNKLLTSQIKYPKYFIGIAPSYNNKTNFSPLTNEEEINEITAVIKNSNMKYSAVVGDSATKKKFFTLISKSKILHIAAHSYADTLNEGTNGIVFDSVLTGSEIIASDINNDLVVLSSCEGGKGKTVSGEGVLSLARDFIKAGAGNLLVALWKVPDIQTKKFMTEFYKQLIKDNNYVEALTRAKLAMIKNKMTAFPNTWAAFVLMN